MWPFKRTEKQPKFSKLDYVFCLVDYKKELHIISGRIVMVKKFMSGDESSIYYQYDINPEGVHTFCLYEEEKYPIDEFFYLSNSDYSESQSVLLFNKLAHDHDECNVFNSLDKAIKVFQYREILRLRKILNK